MNKKPKTIEEQIQLLQSRNMSFQDITKAPHFHANISYYRLKGYWWEMQDDNINHHFRDGSFFEDVIQLYNFDRNFRLIVFNAIERIEIALRTKMIYHLSIAFGADWYLNSDLFHNKPALFMLLIQVRCEASEAADIVFYFKAFATKQMA